MILIGLGSNVTGPGERRARRLARALGELDRLPVRLEQGIFHHLHRAVGQGRPAGLCQCGGARAHPDATA
jgi:hypothetical protein